MILNFGDNDKAIFGAGSDLQIYHHSGGNSIIAETGTGDLFVQATNIQLEVAVGNNMIIANSGGAVSLYHNAGEKLATTSTGITVTGTGDADTGILTTHSRSGVGYTLRLNNTNNGANKGTGIKWSSGGFDTGAIIVRSDAVAASGDAPGYMTFHTSADGTESVTERMRITSSGNVGIGTTSPNSYSGYTALTLNNAYL